MNQKHPPAESLERQGLSVLKDQPLHESPPECLPGPCLGTGPGKLRGVIARCWLTSSRLRSVAVVTERDWRSGGRGRQARVATGPRTSVICPMALGDFFLSSKSPVRQDQGLSGIRTPASVPATTGPALYPYGQSRGGDSSQLLRRRGRGPHASGARARLRESGYRPPFPPYGGCAGQPLSNGGGAWRWFLESGIRR